MPVLSADCRLGEDRAAGCLQEEFLVVSRRVPEIISTALVQFAVSRIAGSRQMVLDTGTGTVARPTVPVSASSLAPS